MSEAPDDREIEDRLDPRDLPRLADFLAAYLHEDLVPVHGSAAAAAFHWIAEADLEEIEELAAEWQLLRSAAARLPLDRLNRLLRERFRSAWYVTSVEEIEAVARELVRALHE